MKVKIQNQQLHGRFVNLPFDGKIAVPADGIVTVSNECANALADVAGYDVLEEAKASTKKAGKAAEKVVEPAAATKTTAKAVEKPAAVPNKEEIRQNLLKTSTDDLKKMCREAELPEDAWGDMKNKLQLVKYVMDNIS